MVTQEPFETHEKKLSLLLKWLAKLIERLTL